MAQPRHTKMYKDSPEMHRDEESGKMKVKKSEGKIHSEASRTADGTEGMPIHERHMHERREMHNRHVGEHHAMHHKHEMEHSMHGHGHKEALHDRHEEEHAEMHVRHHGEKKKLHAKHEKEHGHMESKGSGNGKEKIEKVEKE